MTSPVATDTALTETTMTHHLNANSLTQLNQQQQTNNSLVNNQLENHPHTDKVYQQPISNSSQSDVNTDDDWLFSDPLGLDIDEEMDADMNDADILNPELSVQSVTNTAQPNIHPHDANSEQMAVTNSAQASTAVTQQATTNNLTQNNMTDSTLINQSDTIHSNATHSTNANQAANPSGDANSPVSRDINADVVIEFDGDTSKANPYFIPLLPEPKHRGESGRQLIMDTETTGLDALKGDRIIEVGIIELVDRKFTGEKLHVYINPERGMDKEVIRVHGISEAFLADKPTFDKVAQKLYDFMLGAEVIAHNAPFDISFLTMEFDKVGLTDFADKITVTDSLVMAKQQYPGQKNTLDALVRRLNVGKMDRTFHGALLDSEILAEVYLAMTGGQVALAIDEDIQTQGTGSHADFSQFASQIRSATAPIENHLQWVASLLKDYPNVAKTQGVNCFYKVDNTHNLLIKKPLLPVMHIDQQLSTSNLLAKDLFISS